MTANELDIIDFNSPKSTLRRCAKFVNSSAVPLEP